MAQRQISGVDTASLIYRWTPVQEAANDGADIPIDTLGVNFLPGISSGVFLEQASATALMLERDNFQQVERSVQCHRLADNFVFCRGYVRSSAQQLPAAVGKLPPLYCPPRVLRFAAFAREADGKAGLAMLLARPDGLIIQVGGSGPGTAIDLSAVRFCQDKGISLVDEVSIHVVNVAGTRVVCLQGTLRQKEFRPERKKGKTQAKVPISCRPTGDMIFVTAGENPGSFNLFTLTAIYSIGEGGFGGEFHWRDSFWRRDRLSLSGVVYQVDPAVLSFSHHVRTEEIQEVIDTRKLTGFRNRIVSVYGSFEKGLSKAFGIQGTEEITFAEFAAGCKLLGFNFEVTRLWEILDEDRSGRVSAAEIVGKAASLSIAIHDELMEGAADATGGGGGALKCNSDTMPSLTTPRGKMTTPRTRAPTERGSCWTASTRSLIDDMPGDMQAIIC